LIIVYLLTYLPHNAIRAVAGTISTLLENEATDTHRLYGLDIADYIIAELKSKKTILEIQNYLSPNIQSMIKRNTITQFLINSLDLVEINS